jgi:hypothetical protein
LYLFPCMAFKIILTKNSDFYRTLVCQLSWYWLLKN